MEAKNDKKEQLCIGILASVDAGKTTLSEGILYKAGAINNFGRVDKKTSFLDNNDIERRRGITVFSKQAEFTIFDRKFTLLDTPGHIDLIRETKRILSVIDMAIFVLDSTDLVNATTKYLWDLLQENKVPTVVFVNKMDRCTLRKNEIIEKLREEFDEGIIEYREDDKEAFFEDISLLDEEILESYLENKTIKPTEISELLIKRKLFPTFFGVAINQTGILSLLKFIAEIGKMRERYSGFAAKIFKVSRDVNGNRLTHLRLLGGKLKVRDEIDNEKITSIRIYSGENFVTKEEVETGEVCTVLGIKNRLAGDGLGLVKEEIRKERQESTVDYSIILPDGINPFQFFTKIKELEQEMPELLIRYIEEKKKIIISLEGDIQREVLTEIIRERYGIVVDFSEGHIVYKESIRGETIGFAHYEPLRHYAEVTLRLVRGKEGSGIVARTELSEEELAKVYQTQILACLNEEHRGVLLGAGLTGIEFILIGGKATRHTSGGDFREATRRAVRQGLMSTECMILAPFHKFSIEVPMEFIGRIMLELTDRGANINKPEQIGELSYISGEMPLKNLMEYKPLLRNNTRGLARMYSSFSLYRPIEDIREPLENSYNPLADIENPADSIFCTRGSSYTVPWNEVYKYINLKKSSEEQDSPIPRESKELDEIHIDLDEINDILKRANSSNRKQTKNDGRFHKRKKAVTIDRVEENKYNRVDKKTESYLLVDGYNVIFEWKELRELARINIDSARDKLIEIMANYQGYTGIKIILVFDAYKTSNTKENIIERGKLWIVYTKKAETADQYIAKITKSIKDDAEVVVATSDALVQMIILGSGAIRLSARELLAEVLETKTKISEKIDKGV